MKTILTILFYVALFGAIMWFDGTNFPFNTDNLSREDLFGELEDAKMELRDVKDKLERTREALNQVNDNINIAKTSRYGSYDEMQEALIELEGVFIH